MERTLTVRDLIAMNLDIDVYDDVCEELGICFCGPMVLTKDGLEHFHEVLDYGCEIVGHSDLVCVVHIDDAIDKIWKNKLRKVKEFFYAAAGYCSNEDYKKWFKEV